MANFGTHYAYPQPPRPTDSGIFHAVETQRAATGVAVAITRTARRVLAAMLRAIDEAPLEMAWPPAARPLGMRREFGTVREAR